MWIILLLLLIALLFIVATLMNKRSRSETPLEILNKRYARGEIDELEYNRRRKALEDRTEDKT